MAGWLRMQVVLPRTHSNAAYSADPALAAAETVCHEGRQWSLKPHVRGAAESAAMRVLATNRAPLLRRGDALVYDSRLWHCGSANVSQRRRRILYFSMAAAGAEAAGHLAGSTATLHAPLKGMCALDTPPSTWQERRSVIGGGGDTRASAPSPSPSPSSPSLPPSPRPLSPRPLSPSLGPVAPHDFAADARFHRHGVGGHGVEVLGLKDWRDRHTAREGVAACVWSTGVVGLSTLLTATADERSQRDGARPYAVIELGAGTGAVGLAFAAAAAARGGGSPCRLTLTDLPPVLPLLRHNAALNASRVPVVTSLPLIWGDADAHAAARRAAGGTPYDVLIGSDLVYSTAAHADLLDTISALALSPPDSPPHSPRDSPPLHAAHSAAQNAPAVDALAAGERRQTTRVLLLVADRGDGGLTAFRARSHLAGWEWRTIATRSTGRRPTTATARERAVWEEVPTPPRAGVPSPSRAASKAARLSTRLYDGLCQHAAAAVRAAAASANGAVGGRAEGRAKATAFGGLGRSGRSVRLASWPVHVIEGFYTGRPDDDDPDGELGPGAYALNWGPIAGRSRGVRDDSEVES